jgi:hypothetical protein
MRKTNPISGSPSVSGNRIVQNEAKLGRTGVSGKMVVVISGANSSESGMCKTNPISPDPGPPGGLVGYALLTAVSARSGAAGAGTGQNSVLFGPAEQAADLVQHGSG